MKILCREINKYDEDCKPAYYIVLHEVNARDIFALNIRSRCNPELKYYATKLDDVMDDDELLELFKKKELRAEPFFGLIR